MDPSLTQCNAHACGVLYCVLCVFDVRCVCKIITFNIAELKSLKQLELLVLNGMSVAVPVFLESLGQSEETQLDSTSLPTD